MKKSICIEKIFLEEDFYDRFKCVKEAGFEYAEFWTWPTRDVPRIAEICEELNLKIASISGDKLFSLIVNEERQEYLDYLGQSIEVAKKLNTQNLVIHSNGMDGPKLMNDGAGISYVKKVASMTRTLSEAAKMAEAAGVTLVLEAVNTYSVPGYFLTKTVDSGDLCRVVGSPNLKILYDIWHMQQMEGNIIRHLTEYKDVLGYIHVGDTPERYEPGSGEVNFDRVKRTLKELGYNGIFGFELVPSSTSARACELIKEF